MPQERSLQARVLGYLARREYSRPELEKKLATHANPPDSDALSAVLDDFEERGFLSMHRAAEQIIRTCRNKFGSQRIAQVLKEKGIDAHFIDDAWPELIETDLDVAVAIWQKKFGTPPSNMKEKGKQMRFMMSRGFSSDVIREVFSQAEIENE